MCGITNAAAVPNIPDSEGITYASSFVAPFLFATSQITQEESNI
jgi:hypothetical protein